MYKGVHTLVVTGYMLCLRVLLSRLPEAIWQQLAPKERQGMQIVLSCWHRLRLLVWPLPDGLRSVLPVSAVETKGPPAARGRRILGIARGSVLSVALLALGLIVLVSAARGSTRAFWTLELELRT